MFSLCQSISPIDPLRLSASHEAETPRVSQCKGRLNRCHKTRAFCEPSAANIGFTYIQETQELASLTLNGLMSYIVYQCLPVVPHKAVAEVSKIGNL